MVNFLDIRTLALKIGLVIVLLVSSAAPGICSAELPPVKSKQSTGSIAIESEEAASERIAKLAKVRAALSEIEVFDDADPTLSAGIGPQHIRERRILLNRLVYAYEQQFLYVTELKSIKVLRKKAAQKTASWVKYIDPPPYSISLSDSLREKLQVEQTKIITSRSTLSKLQQVEEEAQSLLKSSEEKIRQLNERIERSVDRDVSTLLLRQRNLVNLRSELAVATLVSLNLKREILQDQISVSGSQSELLKRQLTIAEPNAIFTHSYLENKIGRIDKQSEVLRQVSAKSQSKRTEILQDIENAKEELTQLQNKQVNPVKIAIVTEDLSLKALQLATSDTLNQIARLKLEGLSLELSIWQLRFTVYHNLSTKALREARLHLATVSSRLILWKALVQQLLKESSSQISLEETNGSNIMSDSELLPIFNNRIQSLREKDGALLNFLRFIERLDRMVSRWNESLSIYQGQLSFKESLAWAFTNVGPFINSLWEFELFAAKDTIIVDGQIITSMRSVTVRKIITAIVIIFTSIWITGLISRFMVPFIARRLKIELSRALLIQRWTRTALIACLVIFSLIIVKIPLTVFAFAGGALAIGLGFGMQTLLRNFISGLILLFERPFTIGDTLEINGQRGTVNEIGLRASVLRLLDGTEILIPNSTLLENNLTNWTYSNRKVRISISVGVAYGSDLRKVIQLLNEAAERHGLVEKEPKVKTLFTDFGDNSLLFQLRFWVNVSKVETAQVASDLRMIISSSFDEHGIEIAFPQQDIHLDAKNPLQVEVIRS